MPSYVWLDACQCVSSYSCVAPSQKVGLQVKLGLLGCLCSGKCSSYSIHEGDRNSLYPEELFFFFFFLEETIMKWKYGKRSRSENITKTVLEVAFVRRSLEPRVLEVLRLIVHIFYLFQGKKTTFIYFHCVYDLHNEHIKLYKEFTAFSLCFIYCFYSWTVQSQSVLSLMSQLSLLSLLSIYICFHKHSLSKHDIPVYLVIKVLHMWCKVL